MAKKEEEKVPKNKIRQAEVREVMRSQLVPAPYNPRQITQEAWKQLKDNLKKVGLLGGIVWNETTGNIVSGHQRVSVMDEVNHYNPDTKENDYPVTVSVAHFDEKTEREQNLFANNVRVQGQFDDNLLREMFSEMDIDYAAAGFDNFDLQVLGVVGISDDDLKQLDREPDMDFNKFNLNQVTEDDSDAAEFAQQTKDSEENTGLDRSKDFYQDTKEQQIARHNEIQKIKDRISNKANEDNDGGMFSYLMLKFSAPAARAHFLQMLGYEDFTITTTDGDEVMRRIEYGEGE